MSEADDAPVRRAIVLSGGGARGAYEAGVLRYVLEEVPKDLGRPVHFDIISGTSVGAINASWLAATIDRPTFCVQRLWYLWRTLDFDRVVEPSYGHLWQVVRSFFGRDAEEDDSLEERRGALLQTGFFEELVQEELPHERIANNLASGYIDGLTVSATNIATGQTTVFAQTASRQLPPWTRDPRRVVVGGPITPAKVLASASIPFLFPPVCVGHQWFCDGGLRQNTPLAPALRLGADRVLVIALRTQPNWSTPGPFEVDENHPSTRYPDPALLLGKLLDALLLDPLDYDLSVLERINGMLRYGEEAFGDDSFVEALNEVVEVYRGQAYTVVDPLLLRPSKDLGRLANEFAAEAPDDFWGSRLMASIIQSAAQRDYQESDLLSYLLFDGSYTGQLLDMGYHDAAAIHDELVAFFEE